jgi:hypothetical protein
MELLPPVRSGSGEFALARAVLFLVYGGSNLLLLVLKLSSGVHLLSAELPSFYSVNAA